MNDPLAALLHKHTECCAAFDHEGRYEHEWLCVTTAIHLRAAGVTLAAPAEGLESLRLVYDAKHDDREFVSGWNGALDAVAALKPAAPAEGLDGPTEYRVGEHGPERVVDHEGQSLAERLYAVRHALVAAAPWVDGGDPDFTEWDAILTPLLVAPIVWECDSCGRRIQPAAPAEGLPINTHHPRYRREAAHEGGGMVPDPSGQWVHVSDLGVEEWSLDALDAAALTPEDDRPDFSTRIYKENRGE